MLWIRVGASRSVEFQLCQVFWFLEGETALLLKVPQETVGEGDAEGVHSHVARVAQVLLVYTFLWYPSLVCSGSLLLQNIMNETQMISEQTPQKVACKIHCTLSEMNRITSLSPYCVNPTQGF